MNYFVFGSVLSVVQEEIPFKDFYSTVSSCDHFCPADQNHSCNYDI